LEVFILNWFVGIDKIGVMNGMFEENHINCELFIFRGMYE